MISKRSWFNYQPMANNVNVVWSIEAIVQQRRDMIMKRSWFNYQPMAKIKGSVKMGRKSKQEDEEELLCKLIYCKMVGIVCNLT